MPVDNRRVAGPETTFDPYAFCPPLKKKILLNKTGKRNDERLPEDIRSIFLKCGVVSQAQGSAYIEQKDTKIICSVYGPREVIRKEEFSMTGQLTCEFKFATFSCQHRRQHMQDSEEKDFSVQLLEALEPAVCLHKFPKAQVNIFIVVLQDGGSALAAAVTCASVAIADAGIEMYDLVTGCSARINGDKIFMDPSSEEEYKAETETTGNNGSVTVGVMSSLRQMSAVMSKGEMEFGLVKDAMNRCVSACDKIYPVQQLSLTKNLEDQMKDKT